MSHTIDTGDIESAVSGEAVIVIAVRLKSIMRKVRLKLRRTGLE